MKIAPLTTEHPWYHQVVGHRRASLEILNEVPVEVEVFVDQVVFAHHGAEQNYRPRLHLSGHMLKITAPGVELPYGISELTFDSDYGPLVNAFYEFSDAQLGNLVAKGYFRQGFDVPEQMKRLPYVLPTTARMIFVSPDEPTGTPAVFVEMPHINTLVLDEHTSGYELSAYFPTLPEPQRDAQAEHEIVKPVEPTIEHARDLFADALDEDRTLSKSVEQAEVVAVQEQVEQVDPDVERLYQEVIASRLDELPTPSAQSMAPAAPAATGRAGYAMELPDGVIVFELDPELDLDHDDEELVFDEAEAQAEAEAEPQAEREASQREQLAQREHAEVSEHSQIMAAIDTTTERPAHRLVDLEDEHAEPTARRAARLAQHEQHVESGEHESDDLELD